MDFFFSNKIKINKAIFYDHYMIRFSIELSSQDFWSLSWVSSYMAYDCMGFNPIPLDVFQTLSLVKALVNGFARLSQDLTYSILMMSLFK